MLICATDAPLSPILPFLPIVESVSYVFSIARTVQLPPWPPLQVSRMNRTRTQLTIVSGLSTGWVAAALMSVSAVTTLRAWAGGWFTL